MRFVAITIGVATGITTSCLTHAEAQAGETSWTTFRSPTLGYSFRYPLGVLGEAVTREGADRGWLLTNA